MSKDDTPVTARREGLGDPSAHTLQTFQPGAWRWIDPPPLPPEDPAYALSIDLPHGPGDDWERVSVDDESHTPIHWLPLLPLSPEPRWLPFWTPPLPVHGVPLASEYINGWRDPRPSPRGLRVLRHSCPCGEPVRERGDVCAECEPRYYCTERVKDQFDYADPAGLCASSAGSEGHPQESDKAGCLAQTSGYCYRCMRMH